MIPSEKKLIAFSVTVRDHDALPGIYNMLELSFSTLRLHSPFISVVLFSHGALHAELRSLCNHFHVMVHESVPYAQLLDQTLPTKGPALSTYPLLHKYLNFETLLLSSYEQVMLCDYDTLFFKPLEPLFDQYFSTSIVAREEVHSKRSHYGYKQSFINEELIAQHCLDESLQIIPPFNTGVMLIHRSAWSRLSALKRTYVKNAWRLALSLGMRSVSTDVEYAKLECADAVRDSASIKEESLALAFPSNNPWILDEVAFWLTVGCDKDLSFKEFDKRDVAQNGELFQPVRGVLNPFVCHYFSNSFSQILDWYVSVQPNLIATESTGDQVYVSS